MTLDLTDLADRSPRGIAALIARSIRAGDLGPGQRLPTVRDVAADLGVSPATVSAAWQALRSNGAIVSRGRAGTFVRDTSDRDTVAPWLSPRYRSLAGPIEAELRRDLSRGTPDPALLPALGPALRRVSSRAGTGLYQDETVLPALRERLAATWPYAAPSITVVDGAIDGVSRTLGEVVAYGDRVVLESPGFPPFYDLVEALGAEVLPVSCDASGIVASSLQRALAARPVAVVLQPRAHNPTGASMSLVRAAALATLLRSPTGPLVVEDDHSGAISTAPLVSFGTWIPDQVVHVRSFSKSHGPDLRIAALGGPAPLVDRIVARRMLGPGWTSRMLQTILLDLLTQSRSVDEVGEARRQYALRQHALTTALAAHGMDVLVPDGINLWLPVTDERAALLRLAAAGVRVAPGSPFMAAGAPGAVVRVTSGLLAPEHAPEVAAALAAAAVG